MSQSPTIIEVDSSVWGKEELFIALYEYSDPVVHLSQDECDYAIGNYYVDGRGTFRSKVDDNELHVVERSGGCCSTSYVRHNPIMTSFAYWPVLYSRFNEYQVGSKPLERIIYSKRCRGDLVDMRAIRHDAQRTRKVRFANPLTTTCNYTE